MEQRCPRCGSNQLDVYGNRHLLVYCYACQTYTDLNWWADRAARRVESDRLALIDERAGAF